MALTPSGQISMSQVNSALGRSSTAGISFSDGSVRFLANQESGSVTMAAMRSKYYFVGTVTVGVGTISSLTTYGYNVSSPAFGAATGNTGTGTIFGMQTNNKTSFIVGTGAVPFAANARYKVGSLTTLPMTYNPPGKVSVSYTNSSTSYFNSGQLGGTYVWQFGSY